MNSAAPSIRTTSPSRSPKSWLLLVVLVAGIAAGFALRHAGPHGLSIAGAVGQFGQLWLNALRMTLVPLVFCLMTAGVASIIRTANAGSVVRTAIAVFTGLLLLGSVAGVVTVLALMKLWPVMPLHATAVAAATTAPPSLLAEFVSLIPSNPIASAAEGAMAPLILFAVAFGAAITRLKQEWTTLVLDFVNAISAAMLVIVGWVLRVAPLGIFCLLVATAATAGDSAAKGLFQYAALTCAVMIVGCVIAQLIGFTSGIGAARFSRTALSTQVLAATTQSSTACLPSLLQAAEALHLPPPIIEAIMPLAVAIFRFGNVFLAVSSGLIGARLFGVHPTFGQITLAIGIAILTNVGSIGVPGGAILFAAFGPPYLALGTPLEALTMLLAIFTLPDIIITVCNVTADLAAASLIARLSAK
jgi:proton glutamate symport protein